MKKFKFLSVLLLLLGIFFLVLISCNHTHKYGPLDGVVIDLTGNNKFHSDKSYSNVYGYFCDGIVFGVLVKNNRYTKFPYKGLTYNDNTISGTDGKLTVTVGNNNITITAPNGSNTVTVNRIKDGKIIKAIKKAKVSEMPKL